ncbi:hypothetical protein Q670_07175 [Alcanivorax sp. P2S70]|nr:MULTISPECIES: OmpW family outer membrane protein [Alcanivorax]ERP85460.1 hypothetical protein Q670_07175 [Alcanivorax sp. P2S70]
MQNIKKVLRLPVLVTGLALCAPVMAQERTIPEYDDVRVDYPGSEFVRDIAGEDRFYFRFGAMYFDPDVTTNSITAKNLTEIGETALGPSPQRLEGEATSDPLLLPGVILGYKLPWGKGWSMELIASAPPTLEIKADGKLANEPLVEEVNGIPTGVPPLGEEVAETKVAPPLITLVKRFRLDHKLQPYLGGGIGYLFTYDTKVTNPIATELGEPDIEVENKFGYALQAGLDIHLTRHWWVTFDTKYISFQDITATVEDLVIKAPGLPQFQYAEVGDVEYDADINALAYTLGIGFTF